MVHPVTAGAASIVSYLALRAVRPYVPALIGDDRVHMVASLALGAGMLIHFKEPPPKREIEVREVTVVDDAAVKALEEKVERREEDVSALEGQLEGTRQFAREVIGLLPNTRAQEELLMELEDRPDEMVHLNPHSLADELAGVDSPVRMTPVKRRVVPKVPEDFELNFPIVAPKIDPDPKTLPPEIKYVDREVVKEVVKWKADPELAQKAETLEKEKRRLGVALDKSREALAAEKKTNEAWAAEAEETRAKVKGLELEKRQLEKQVKKLTEDRNWYKEEYGKAVELLKQRSGE